MKYFVNHPDTGEETIIEATEQEMAESHQNPQLLRDKIAARQAAEATKRDERQILIDRILANPTAAADIVSAFSTPAQRRIIANLLARIAYLEQLNDIDHKG